MTELRLEPGSFLFLVQGFYSGEKKFSSPYLFCHRAFKNLTSNLNEWLTSPIINIIAKFSNDLKLGTRGAFFHWEVGATFSRLTLPEASKQEAKY